MASPEPPRVGHALPPSPPPSPPRRRHHRNRSADPFLELSNTPVSFGSSPSSPKDEQTEGESLITKILITPLLMTSFLLSLFFVDNTHRLRRANSHPSRRSSYLSYLSYLSPYAWLDPDPYQDPSDSTWDRRDSAVHVEPNSVLSNASQEETDKKRDRKRWFLHKKIRKVTRLEIGDAFEMRARIMVCMCALLVMVVVSVGMGVKWAVAKMW